MQQRVCDHGWLARTPHNAFSAGKNTLPMTNAKTVGFVSCF
jgi:hypothetical protein